MSLRSLISHVGVQEGVHGRLAWFGFVSTGSRTEIVAAILPALRARLGETRRRQRAASRAAASSQGAVVPSP
jgi:hypothetical protein